MGGFLSSIFTGNNPTLNKDANNLGSLAGYSTGVGEAGTTGALNYDLGILSGDPTKVAQTLAPETQQLQTEAQQNKNTVAQFGNRGGGMNAVMAGLDDATRSKLLGLAGGLRQGAAANAGQLGTSNLGMAAGDTAQQAKIAQQQQENMLNSILGKSASAGSGWLLNKLLPGSGSFFGGNQQNNQGPAPSNSNPYAVLAQAQNPGVNSVDVTNYDPNAPTSI